MSYPPLGAYFKSQLVTTLPYPTKSFAGKTVIVTGSTAGLGLEAARHLVRLNATQVILAIRNVEKGRTVAADIERSTNKTGVIKVWELDHASYDSVKSFSKRCDGLERLDVVIANAGTHPRGPFAMAEDNETTVTVNFVTTMLLGLSLLPKLRKTATDFDTDVVLTFVGSFVFWMAKFPQSKADKILAELADESSYDLEDRYNATKTMLLLAYRQLVKELTQPARGRIITSIINPGSVKSDMSRANHGFLKFAYYTIFRKTEEGSRTLVHGAEGRHDTDGKYLCDCKPAGPELMSPWMTSESAYEVQERLWGELLDKLEEISPGVRQNI